jgi:peptide/nickel transport system substrate-binding protein
MDRISTFLFSTIIILLSLSSCKGCKQPPPTPYKASQKTLKSELKRFERSFSIKQTPRPKVDKSKTIIVAVPYLPSHLNPYIPIEKWGYQISMHQIYEGLIGRDPKTGKLIPSLATSWNMEPSGKVYRFWLRKGVRWQDGRPLSVEDVVFSFSLLTIPKIKKSTFIKDINWSLMRIDKIGSRGVRIVLQHPNAYFLEHLPELPILPAHLFYKGVSSRTRTSKFPVGTGPYRLHQWVKDKSIILERNEFYWGSTPEIERVEFRKISDPAKAFVGIRRREIDLLPAISPVHYPIQVTENIKKDYKLYKFIPPNFSYLLWNTRNKVLSDFRVRRALSMLINRKGIIDKVYRGLAIPCKGPFWRPGGLGDPKITPPPYDPAKAKILLSQVGWEDHDGDGIRDKQGRPMRLIVLLPVGANRENRVLETIKNDFFKAGIELIIVPTDWKLLGKHLKSRKFSAAYLTWAGRPYEDFSPIFHSAGRNNYSVIYSIFIDRLLSKMRRQTEFSAMFELSKLLENNLRSNPPMTFLFRPIIMSVLHKRFSNISPTWEGFQFANFKLKKKQNKPIKPKTNSKSK